MHFGFPLELSDIDLWNTDLLDTHLDLLFPDKYTDIPSKYFVCLHKIFKTTSRHAFKISSRHLHDMSLKRLQDMSARRLQDIFSLAIFCYAEDVLKTSSRPTNVCWVMIFTRRLISIKFEITKAKSISVMVWSPWPCFI